MRNKEVGKILHHVVSDIITKSRTDDQFFCSICHKIKRTGVVCRFHADRAGSCTVCMSEVCK
jgi:hypothetical protein